MSICEDIGFDKYKCIGLIKSSEGTAIVQGVVDQEGKPVGANTQYDIEYHKDDMGVVSWNLKVCREFQRYTTPRYELILQVEFLEGDNFSNISVSSCMGNFSILISESTDPRYTYQDDYVSRIYLSEANRQGTMNFLGCELVTIFRDLKEKGLLNFESPEITQFMKLLRILNVDISEFVEQIS